jgi:hypothetical protein
LIPNPNPNLIGENTSFRLEERLVQYRIIAYILFIIGTSKTVLVTPLEYLWDYPINLTHPRTSYVIHIDPINYYE